MKSYFIRDRIVALSLAAVGALTLTVGIVARASDNRPDEAPAAKPAAEKNVELSLAQRQANTEASVKKIYDELESYRNGNISQAEYQNTFVFTCRQAVVYPGAFEADYVEQARTLLENIQSDHPDPAYSFNQWALRKYPYLAS